MNNLNVDYVTLHYRSVLNDFSNQFLNEEFSDCMLNAEGRSLKVHKAMLSAQSSFLEKMILEHQTIGDLCFIIEGVSFEDLKSVVQFMYSGSAKLYKQNFGSFLVVAELLGVKWLDRLQIQSESEQSSQEINVSEADPSAKSVTTQTQPIEAFKDLTNCLNTKSIKRKKHMKSRKHCKRSKCSREDHKTDCKKHKVNNLRHCGSRNENHPGKETHLADMDENTFCTALGLQKNQLQSRDQFKPDGVTKTDVKFFTKTKSVPPLIKINREIKSGSESYDTRDANMYVSEISTVYIEDKNLSFLNIGANELCIRENNIEIECDVLDASSSQFVIEKEPVASIVELREENIIQAEFVDINTACEDSSSYSDSTTRESITSLGGSSYNDPGPRYNKGPPHSSSAEPVRKSSRPCRRKTCSALAAAAAAAAATTSSVIVKKSGSSSSSSSISISSSTIDKTYLEGSTLFWCDVCQRTYHTKTGLNQHKRYECCKEPAFACPRCEKRFKRKSSLVRHAITLHDEAIFPTRTKLLSKLTGQGERSILTIGERAVVKAEPNYTEERSCPLQLENSDWSSSSEDSDSSICDDTLTPVSSHDSTTLPTDYSESVADPSAAAVVAPQTTVPDTDKSAVPETNGETTLITNGPDRPIESSEILENGCESEPELPDNDPSPAKANAGYVYGMISKNYQPDYLDKAADSTIVDEETFNGEDISDGENDLDQSATTYGVQKALDRLELNVDAGAIDNDLVEPEPEPDAIPFEDDITIGSDDVHLSLESPLPSSSEYETPKHIEIISPEEKDAELDCGVEPLPDLQEAPLEFTSEPSPDPSIPSPPPQRSSYPADDSIPPAQPAPVPPPPVVLVKKIHKQTDPASKPSDEAAKQGSVIIRHRGKILRKSSRTKKKRTTQRKDSFQEYLEKTFELKPFIIRLPKYRTGSEPNETEKLHFLSNFNLKKKGVFPCYSDHAYARALSSSVRVKSPRAKQRGRPRLNKIDPKCSKVLRKKKQPIDLSRFHFSKIINSVEIERLEEHGFSNHINIHEDHSYNFRENEPPESEFPLDV